jgi:hypothetical protein
MHSAHRRDEHVLDARRRSSGLIFRSGPFRRVGVEECQLPRIQLLAPRPVALPQQLGHVVLELVHLALQHVDRRLLLSGEGLEQLRVIRKAKSGVRAHAPQDARARSFIPPRSRKSSGALTLIALAPLDASQIHAGQQQRQILGRELYALATRRRLRRRKRPFLQPLRQATRSPSSHE